MIDPSELSAGDTASGRLSNAPIGVRIHRLKFLISNYWWIVALTIAVGLAVQGYRCSQQVIQYVSSSRMMVNGHVSIPQGDTYSEELLNFYGTQVALMKSRDTLAQAVARVRAIHPEMAIDENVSVGAAQELKTSIFDLQVVSTSPEYAKALLDSIMETYLSIKRGRKNQTTSGAVAAITEEISHLDSQMRSDEQELLNFQKQNNVVFIEEQSNSASSYLASLNNELARLTKEHDLLALENDSSLPPSAMTAAASSGKAEGPPVRLGTNGPSAVPGDGGANTADAALVAELQNIEKLKILRDEYSLYLKDAHPKMKDLTDEINKELKFVEILKTQGQAARDAHLQDLGLQIKNLQNQIVDWNKKSLELSERLATYQQLKSKIEREQTLYSQLTSSIQSVNLNKSLDQEDVVIMEAASPASPIPPGYPLQLMYGAIFGLAAGCAILYLIHRLDDKIDSPLELEDSIEFPLVGQIPLTIQDKRTKRAPLLSENDQRHMLVESHRNIRSAILFRSSYVTKPTSLLVSSAIPGEGKSTLTANLAIIFALSGARVLLIDADLRRGVQHNLFETPLSPGLSDYLLQTITWRQAIKNTHLPNLDVLPRGKVPQQAGDLLVGSLADVLIHETAAEYDMVLWDSAPLLAADDASNLCSKVGGVLFVARTRYSSIHSVRSALEELSQRNAKIFGIVLNAVSPDQPGYYDKYRYKEYYATAAEA